MVLTAYSALSLVTSSCLPPSPRGLNGISCPGWADDASARLSISNGCQDHTPSPYATAPFVLRARGIAHEARPPCDIVAPDAARVHRIPRSTFVTIAIRPSLVEAGWRDETTYFRKTEAQYFSREDWQAKSR
jgi:hypothetical protein